MANRVLVGLGTIIGLLMGFAPGVVPMDSLLMVVIGIVYAVMNVDAEDATGFLVVAIAVGLATGDHTIVGHEMDDHMMHHHGVLTHIPVIGEQLSGAFGALQIALYAGVATVAATRIFNRLKG